MKVLLIPSYSLVLVQNVIASQSYVESQDASLCASDVKLLILAPSLLLWPPVSLSSLHSRTCRRRPVGNSLLEDFVVGDSRLPALLTMTASMSFPSPASPTISCLLFPKRLLLFLSYGFRRARVECDSSYSEFSGVCGEGEGQASGLRPSYTEACYECLAGRAKGLSWNPKAISPSSCWMNCEVKDPGMYLDMERSLETSQLP